MSRPELPVRLADVLAARERIAGLAVPTPLVPSVGLARPGDARTWLKLENVQPTGSFKVRGAASRINAMGAAERARGVVTASTGNHGRAVAYVAARLGLPAVVCVSVHVPAGKLAALEASGCEVLVGGDSQTDALATAERLVAARGLTLIHPFDDPLVIAGQGTIGCELLDQLPDLSTVVVPLSGGGLLSGIAVAVKALRPAIRVVGVTMARAPVMAASIEAGRPVELDEAPTLADSLQGGIGRTNATTFPITRALIDEVVLLTEQEIWNGMRFAFEEHRLVLEGGGAVGIAAVLAGHLGDRSGQDVALVCSGGNAEAAQVMALAEHRATPPGDPAGA